MALEFTHNRTSFVRYVSFLKKICITQNKHIFLPVLFREVWPPYLPQHFTSSRCSPLRHIVISFPTLTEIDCTGQIADYLFKGTLQINDFDFKCGCLIAASSKACVTYPLVEGIHLVLVSCGSWWVICWAVWVLWRVFPNEWMDSFLEHQQCLALQSYKKKDVKWLQTSYRA